MYHNTDRRIVKTRQGLQAAFLSLLREMPFEKIEIQEITDRANTARATFYRHYGTKEELLLDVIEHIYEELIAQRRAISVDQILDFRQPPPAQMLFSFLERDRALQKKLFSGSVSALIQQRIRHYIVEQIIQAFTAMPLYADLPVVLIANHVASVTIGNIMWWLLDDLPYSGEYIARLSYWMGLAGALTVIGHGDKLTMPPPEAWKIPDPSNNADDAVKYLVRLSGEVGPNSESEHKAGE
jgi:AcrR family transcriptional regulator